MRLPSARIAGKGPRPNYAKLDNPASRRKPLDANLLIQTDQALVSIGHQLSDDPQSLEEAQDRPDWPKWKEAMDIEMNQLLKAGTWELQNLPPDRKAVSNRWVYHLKTNNDGQIIKYKSRLVARGCSQIPGIDFFDTYAPALTLDTLRTIISIATIHDLELHHLDVKSAYLNGDLTDDIYMAQPSGYEDGTNRVCKLQKAIYGLKQAGRIWSQLLSKTFLELGYARSRADSCLYYQIQGSDLILVGVHVDDITIAAKATRLIKSRRN